MVQPTHLRNGDDRALPHDRPRLRSVLFQSQVRSRLMIVCQIIPQHLAKVLLTENYNMVQTLTSNRAD